MTVPTPLRNLEPRREELRLHGRRISYLTAGEGPVLLLVHGIAVDGEVWRAVLPLLARRAMVIAPDLPGHGASAKAPGDYSLGSLASSLRDLLVKPGHERATLVGHSLGGGVAMQFAYMFAERTERLVLVSRGGLGRGFDSAPAVAGDSGPCPQIDDPHLFAAAVLEFLEETDPSRLTPEAWSELLRNHPLSDREPARPGRESVRR